MASVADGGDAWRKAAEAAGEAVVAARVEAGYRTRAQFADDIGLTTKTLGQVERGDRPSYDRSTYATIDQALKWESGTFENLLAGRREPADLGKELMTASGVFANLYAEKIELAHLIANSPLDAEQRFAIIREHRRRQNEFTRAEEERIRAEIEKLAGS